MVPVPAANRGVTIPGLGPASAFKDLPPPSGTKTTFNDDGGVATEGPAGGGGGGGEDGAPRELTDAEVKAAHAEFKEQVPQRVGAARSKRAPKPAARASFPDPRSSLSPRPGLRPRPAPRSP